MSLSFKEAREIFANICSNASKCSECPLADCNYNCLMGKPFIDDDYIESILLEEKANHWKSNLDRVADADPDIPSGKELAKLCFYHCPGEYLPYGPKCTAEEKKIFQHNGRCFNCWLKKGWLRSE